MSGMVHRYRPVPKHFIQRENRNDLRNEIDKLAWYWATAWRHQIEVVDRCCIGWRWLGSIPPCLRPQLILSLNSSIFFDHPKLSQQNENVGNGDWLCCCSTSGRRVTSQINWPAVSWLPVKPCRSVNVVWYMGNMPRIARYRPATSLLAAAHAAPDLLVVWIVQSETGGRAEYMQLVLIHRFDQFGRRDWRRFGGVLTSLYIC
jgi:hypothetical protein